MIHGRFLLAKYLADNRLLQADLARDLGLSSSLVCNYLSEPTAAGHRDPGLVHAFAIEEWTKGKVPAKSWVNGKARKRRSRNRKAA